MASHPTVYCSLTSNIVDWFRLWRPHPTPWFKKTRAKLLLAHAWAIHSLLTYLCCVYMLIKKIQAPCGGCHSAPALAHMWAPIKYLQGFYRVLVDVRVVSYRQTTTPDPELSRPQPEWWVFPEIIFSCDPTRLATWFGSSGSHRRIIRTIRVQERYVDM